MEVKTRVLSREEDHAMAAATSIRRDNVVVGPHPSFIQLAHPYISEQKLQQCMTAIGMSQAKEDSIRLQGVSWIDNVRKSLQLYVKCTCPTK